MLFYLVSNYIKTQYFNAVMYKYYHSLRKLPKHMHFFPVQKYLEIFIVRCIIHFDIITVLLFILFSFFLTVITYNFTFPICYYTMNHYMSCL